MKREEENGRRGSEEEEEADTVDTGRQSVSECEREQIERVLTAGMIEGNAARKKGERGFGSD